MRGSRVIAPCSPTLMYRQEVGCRCRRRSFFFFNDTATTEIYTLSLHDALPIFVDRDGRKATARPGTGSWASRAADEARSEEHTSELQSQSNLVCRLLLEKKKKRHIALPDIHREARSLAQVCYANMPCRTDRLCL